MGSSPRAARPRRGIRVRLQGKPTRDTTDGTAPQRAPRAPGSVAGDRAPLYLPGRARRGRSNVWTGNARAPWTGPVSSSEMDRFVAVRSRADLFPQYGGTPIGDRVEYHNRGRPFRSYARARLLIGRCTDHRKHLHIPENCACIIRAGGQSPLQRVQSLVRDHGGGRTGDRADRPQRLQEGRPPGVLDTAGVRRHVPGALSASRGPTPSAVWTPALRRPRDGRTLTRVLGETVGCSVLGPGRLRPAFGKVSIVPAGAPGGLLHPALWFVTADPS